MAYPSDFKMIIRDSIIHKLFNKPLSNVANEITSIIYDIAKETDEFNRKIIYRVYIQGKYYFTCKNDENEKYFYLTHLSKSVQLELTDTQKLMIQSKLNLVERTKIDKLRFHSILTQLLLEVDALHDIYKIFPKEMQDIIPYRTPSNDSILPDSRINILKEKYKDFLSDLKTKLTLNLLLKDVNYE
jgi:hypothetical protein